MKKELKEKLPDYYIGIGLCFGIAFGAAMQKLKKV
ncbi:uncharacterized protein METZ01_LOCUS441944, partial [marine metagenome]